MSVPVQVSVAKETYELCKGLSDFGVALAGAVADGWQVGKDLPVVLSSALSILVPALQGAEKIKDEYAANKSEVLLAAVLPVVTFIEKIAK